MSSTTSSRSTASGVREADALMEIFARINEIRERCSHTPRESFERASRLADELKDGNPFARACALLTAAEACDHLGWNEEMNRAYGIVDELSGRIEQPHQRAQILYGLGIFHHHHGRLTEAYKTYQTAFELAVSAASTAWIATIARNLGLVAQHAGEYDRALQYYFQALEGLDDTSHPHFRTSLLLSIGQAYSEMRDDAQALTYFERTLQLARQNQQDAMEAVVLTDLAVLYMDRSEVQESIALLKEADEVRLRFGGDGENRVGALITLVDAYLKGDVLDDAEDAVRTAVELAATTTNPIWSVKSLLRRATVLERKQDLDAAFQDSSRALEIALAEEGRPMEKDAREVLARICAALGDYAAAYEHSARWGEMMLDMIGEERQKEVARLELRHAIEIDRREREMLQLRAERAEQTVEAQNRELSAATLVLTKRNEALQSLRAAVRPLARDEKGRARAVASAVLERIEEVMDSHDEWGVFEEQFEKLHHDFIVRLRERSSALTPTEIRVCVLLRLNLPTKQIADILCSSPDTVKVHRKHIRKKLGVVADDNLTSLLLAL